MLGKTKMQVNANIYYLTVGVFEETAFQKGLVVSL